MLMKSTRADKTALLVAEGCKNYAARRCRDVSFALYPGEVLAIVGESGSASRRCCNCCRRSCAERGARVVRMRDG
jgi:putative phosphonate transport system ATP-binding protein